MSEQKGKSGLLQSLIEANWVEPLLGALIAVYGIFTAWAAYTGSIYGGNSVENYFVGLAELSKANSDYALADQIYTGDNDAITQWVIHEELGSPAGVMDAIVSNLSELARESLERSQDLDQEYLSALYDSPDARWDNANAAFVAGKQWDDLGDSYELLVLYLATGLGFLAWASLLQKENITRYAFSVMGIGLLVWSIYVTVDLSMKPVPPMVTALPEETEPQ